LPPPFESSPCDNHWHFQVAEFVGGVNEDQLSVAWKGFLHWCCQTISQFMN
jgi:hypothetical protein